jgi:outer membrane protein TolC
LRLLVLAGLVLLPGVVAAGPGVPESRIAEGPELADLVRYAHDANPAVQAARDAWEAAGGQSAVETALPDPALLLTWNTEGTDTLQARKWGVMLSQAIPFPGKLAALGRARSGAELAAQLEYGRAVRDVLLQLRESYHELLYIGEARRIASRTRELLALLHRAGETGYARDRTALSQLLKAESQEAQVGYDETLLGELERVERARLNALLSRPPEAPIGPLRAAPPAEVVSTREEIVAAAEASREEVRLAAAGVREARALVEVAAAENRPELMVGLGYESEDPVVEGDPRMNSYTFQLGLSLPLWPGKNAGRRRAAEAAAARAAALEVSARDEVRAQVTEAYFRLGNARRLADLYGRTLLPQSERAMTQADTWYREGVGSFADYVETVAVWYNFQLAQARALADYGKALARLEALAGRQLTERGAAVPAAAEGVP